VDDTQQPPLLQTERNTERQEVNTWNILPLKTKIAPEKRWLEEDFSFVKVTFEELF